VAASILVADDDADFRAWLRESLEGAGYSVIEAANGKKVMDLLKQSSVDLCITDLAMPEQEGIETIRQLRRQYPALKIIAISGVFGPQYLRMSKFLGAAATLQKPVRLEHLLLTIHQILTA
jgi:two-component system, chemotaxis family, chemotaxis protein CheY